MVQNRPTINSRAISSTRIPISILLTMILASLLILRIYPMQLQFQPAKSILHVLFSRGNDVDKTTTLRIEGGRLQELRQALRSDDGTIMLIDSERTLWTAGWNARYTRYYEELIPAISWTVDAEDIFKREYRRLNFPPNCAEVKGYVPCLAISSPSQLSSKRDMQSRLCLAPYFS